MAALTSNLKSINLKAAIPIGLILAYLLVLPNFAPNDYTLHVWIVAFYYAILACYAAMVLLIITTLEAIFKAALYCHVRGIETPGEVLPNIAGAAIVPDVSNMGM